MLLDCELQPAIFPRDRHPEQAELTHLLHDRLRNAALIVDLQFDWLQLFVGEAADRVEIFAEIGFGYRAGHGFVLQLATFRRVIA